MSSRTFGWQAVDTVESAQQASAGHTSAAPPAVVRASVTENMSSSNGAGYTPPLPTTSSSVEPSSVAEGLSSSGVKDLEDGWGDDDEDILVSPCLLPPRLATPTVFSTNLQSA